MQLQLLPWPCHSFGDSQCGYILFIYLLLILRLLTSIVGRVGHLLWEFQFLKITYICILDFSWVVPDCSCLCDEPVVKKRKDYNPNYINTCRDSEFKIQFRVFTSLFDESVIFFIH